MSVTTISSSNVYNDAHVKQLSLNSFVLQRENNAHHIRVKMSDSMTRKFHTIFHIGPGPLRTHVTISKPCHSSNVASVSML